MGIAFIIIVSHFIADFVFQTEHMAMNKSKSLKPLLNHTITYTWIYTILFSVLLLVFTNKTFDDPIMLILFILTIFITHTVIDYITSKIVSEKFKNKIYYTGIPNFGGVFSIIGLDQVFHYGTLFLIYTLAFN